MRVLWLVSTIFPYPAKKLGIENTVFGGWLQSMFKEINKHNEFQMGIITNYKGKELKKFSDDKNVYYLVPDNKPSKYNNKLSNYYNSVIEEFKPDIIHIHGTEYPRGLVLLNCSKNIPVITSIQGLAGNVADIYYGNIKTKDLIKNITFRDIIKFNTIFDCQKDFYKRSKYEREIIKKSNYIIGRTNWDKANVLAINSSVKYFHLNEMLRDAFYENRIWNINSIEKYSLFCSQSSYPIKGLHIILKSMEILKAEYPNIKLYISGMNIIDESNLKVRLKRIGYGKYIKKLINNYGLKDNIIFTGFLNDKEVANRLYKTHVFVSSSFIENESNSLSEALACGTPSVCSYVGGVTERIIHNETGFHYPVTEPAMLAYFIKQIFTNDELAQKFSKNGNEFIIQKIDRENNYQKLKEIYQKIKEETYGK